MHIPGVPEEIAVVCRQSQIQNGILKTENWELLDDRKTATWQILNYRHGRLIRNGFEVY